MSVLFPKVNKMPDWDYRPIYYDPQKEERDKRRKSANSGKQNGEQKESHSLHRGSFREARDNDTPMRKSMAQRTSRLAFWIALLLTLLFCFYYLL